RARAAVVSHHAPPHGLPGAHDPPRAMTDRAPGFALPPDVEPELEGVAPCEIAIGVLTYNNAETVPAVAKVVRAGLERHFAGARAVLINADAGSTDGTPDLLAAAGLPLVRARHATPLAQRVAVPFHGVPPPRAARPRCAAPGPNRADVWVQGTAIAAGFAVWEAWLGHRRATSRTLTPDLPTMVVQAVGGLFAVMGGYDDLWLDIRGSEPVPTAGA